MSRARLIAVTVTALLFAQIQCVAACATQWCGANTAKTESVPPCHHQHGQSNSQSPQSCTHQALSAAAILDGMPGAAVPQLLAPAAVIPSAVPDISEAPEFDSPTLSPPRPPHLSNIVLRI